MKISPVWNRAAAAGVAGLLLAAQMMHAEDTTAPGAPLVAFPGAEGFGAYATGGRTGTVYHVTNLNDDGPGSFRDAVSQPNRIVVFDVGGLIKLKTNISLSSNLTLAGQTAPGEGVCVYGQSVSAEGEHNIIIRYLRFRQGISGGAKKKAFSMGKSSDMILDHCTIQWGRWDNLGLTQGCDHITVQNCIVAEGINPQAFGSLTDEVTNITFSHNLWINNESRNPKVKGTAQYINNVVYDWGITGLCGGHSAADHYLDVINNYFIKGPASKNNQFAGQCLPTDHIYQKGNLADLDCDGILNGQPVEEKNFSEGKTYPGPTFVPQPTMNPPVPVTVDSAADAYAKAVAGAGCSLHRDAVDLRLISELTSLGKLGKVHLKDENEVGGQGPLAGGTLPAGAAKNGIPDAWETAHGLSPSDSTAPMKITPSGYTNLELYINSLAVTPAPSTSSSTAGAN
ncbi:MAG: hypothetical protein ABSH19_04250 [Opitutales bacterium]|jgi:pectate lyase